MILPLRTLAFCTVGLLSFAFCPAAIEVGSFFEPDQPFFDTLDVSLDAHVVAGPPPADSGRGSPVAFRATGIRFVVAAP